MKRKLIKFIALTIISALMVLLLPPASVVNAAALTDKSDTLSTLTASTVADHTILFTTPTGVAAGETITLTLTSFSVAAALDFEDLDLSFEATPDGVCDAGDTEKVLAASASGSTWGAVRTSATVITFTSDTDTIAAGAEVCVEIGTNAESVIAGIEQITNPAAGSYTLAIAGIMADSGNVAIEIITDDSVAVTATVSESLTFAITDVAIGFGTLVAANARFASADATGTDGPTSASAHNLTIATNATSGYTITYNGATLTSGSDTIAVATWTGDEDGVPGGAQFAIGFSNGAGDAVVVTAYNQKNPTFNYSFVASTTTTIISETGPTTTETIAAYYIANISGATEAGSYSTSITYIATANF